MSLILIADSGSTKTEWCLLNGNKKTKVITQGISPYFLTGEQVVEIIRKELLPKLKKAEPDQVFFYGTGCSNPANVKMIRKSIQTVFSEANVKVDHDLAGAAKALCGDSKGIACILGTGSNSCYYNGKRIVKNSPGWVMYLAMKAAALISAKK
jgi:glucosamine kinase